jgi:ATP-binding cassette subfamily C (CFTR/MRP) protein 1
MANGGACGIQVLCFEVAGAMQFTNNACHSDYSLRYRPELDLVLKSISFKLVWFAMLGYGGRTDKSFIVLRREGRNLWPNGRWKVICKICRLRKVPVIDRPSQLLLALFRIIEPADGTILIDGVDITKIGLNDLRSAMTIVPQSPDLFEGTIRENIDPVGEYQDTDIWEALNQVSLHFQRCMVIFIDDIR